MKVTIEQEGYKSVVESDNVVICDVLDDVIHALLGAGFQLESVQSAVISKAEEYCGEDDIGK